VYKMIIDAFFLAFWALGWLGAKLNTFIGNTSFALLLL